MKLKISHLLKAFAKQWKKQMKLNVKKRAIIAESEGTMQAKINVAEGDKQEAHQRSEREKLRKINESVGKTSEIEAR